MSASRWWSHHHDYLGHEDLFVQFFCVFQKNIYFCFIDYAKAFDCVDHNKLENSETDGNTSPSWEICMQVSKQQLELDMEQQTGSK